jgi:uncharacterized protein
LGAKLLSRKKLLQNNDQNFLHVFQVCISEVSVSIKEVFLMETRKFSYLIICLLAIGLILSLVPQNISLANAEQEKAAVGYAIEEETKEANPLFRKRWSPYASGIGIGILSWVAFLLMGKGLGASSSFVKTSGMIEKVFSPEKVEKIAYYKKISPKINSGWMVVAGIIVGSFLSSTLSGDFHLTAIPVLWEEMFGSNPLIRIVVAFIGGTILIFGARWAGGCTSGHGITGALQLAVSSWMALIAFFIGGIIAAYIIYGFAR